MVIEIQAAHNFPRHTFYSGAVLTLYMDKSTTAKSGTEATRCCKIDA